MVEWKYPMKPVNMKRPSIERLPLHDYTMERKFDGHRAIVVAGRDSVALWTRQKTKIKTPKNLKEAIESLKLPEGTVLDGEIWNPLKRGGWDVDSGEPCVLSLWDCVRRGLSDLSAKAIEERRAALGELLRGAPDDVRQVEVVEQVTLQVAEEIEREAREFRQEKALRSGYVHGVVLKRRKSPRRDHATKSQEHPDWLKLVFEGMSGWEHRPA